MRYIDHTDERNFECFDVIRRADTGVEFETDTHEEWAREVNMHDSSKWIIRYQIAKLEEDLIRYSRPHMEYCMLPNTIEDIVDKLKKLYKYQNQVYCRDPNCSSVPPSIYP